MVLCFCSVSHGGLGKQNVSHEEHLYYCEFYGDDHYGIDWAEMRRTIQIISRFALNSVVRQ